MKRIFLFALIVLVCLPILNSCHYHISRSGLDHFKKYGNADSETDISGGSFLNVEFLDKYPYLDGFYNYDDEGGGWDGTTDRAFSWLTYNQDIYEQAKQECIETRESENPDLDGKQAFGFTFYLNYEWDADHELMKFPHHFTAFGYNDEKCTLVFIGFYGGQHGAERETVATAKTDLEGFIKNYFGEWYDWEE